MPTANESYFDATLRHQVGIRRFATGEVKMILRILQDADRELIRKLRVSLAKLKTQRRLESLLRDVKAARRELVVELRRRLRPDLLELAVDEVAFEQALIQAAVPWTIGFAQVNLTQVRAAVTSKPFNGRFLRQWWQSLSTRDAANVEQAIRLGFAQGETTQQMVTRLAGTRREGFRDGILSITRRDAEGVVRTAVNHVSNAAREAVWEANPEMIAGLRWTATLDGRTTRICAARDGRVAPAEGREAPAGYPLLVPPGARPPAHFNCVLGDSCVTPCGGIAAATKRLYDGEVIVIRTLSGNELTCTPNHPILTDVGWVAAQFLEKGSRVVRYLGSKDPFARVEVKDDERPSTIEEIARPLLEERQVQLVTTSRHDFHGDGTDGEVCVVGTDRRLVVVEEDASGLHHLIKQRLEAGARIHLPCFGSSTFAELEETLFPPPGCFVSGRRLASALLERAGIPHTLSGGAPASSLDGVDPGRSAGGAMSADWDAEFLENAIDDYSAEFATSAEVVDAFAGEIALDEVVYVGRRDFSGHVYNLETGSGIYAAESIITHNCRSVMVAILDGEGLIGRRPSVVDVRTAARRELDFRKIARETGRPIQEVRAEWAREAVGQVPSETTYNQWLKRQKATFQDEVLGRTRGRLFRKGDLDVQQFVDRFGNELTLEQLRQTLPQAFELAGV